MSRQRTARPPGREDTSILFDAVTVDRSSPIPLWFQVAQGAQELITSGELPAGSHLDSEIVLSEGFGVSRLTLRRAMEYLVDHGLIVRRRGLGTTVVRPMARRRLGLTSLFDDLADSGQRPKTRVLLNEVAPADQEIAAALEVPEGHDVTHLVRLRSAGEQPIAVMTNYLPADLEFSTQDIERSGLYALMRSRGVVLHAAAQAIGARKAEPPEARLLHEACGAALLTMQRTAYDDHGRPVEHGTHIYAASRYSFDVQLFGP